ncbi:MAG: type II toxin-antitoxin system HicA family toxin [Candidatus Thorarchaeota archaeon]|nr:type II toxin-antitoxin system HicA family toxin [Candidatus Thorarchaeota archaeon]
MSRLPLIDSTKLIRQLLKAGFQYAPVRGKGSHVALVRYDSNGKPHLVIIPHRNPIPKGTLLAIIKQSGLSKEEFLGLLL